MNKFKKVIVHSKKGDFEGLLISSEGDLHIIKLKNGYNIGIRGDLEIIDEISIDNQDLEEQEEGDVVIIGCGGTIASRVDYATGAVFPSINPSSLASQFPELKDISSIETIDLLSVFSEDLNTNHWTLIAKEVHKHISKNKPVVLLHGTDTMHYSSAALSFAFGRPNKPIIFTGAQRSSDRPSSDNKLNLLNAVFSAKKNINDVAIAMHATTNDDYIYLHKGTNVRKMHSSRRDAFKSINVPPVAKVDYRTNTFEILYEPKHSISHFKPEFNENVAIVYYYPGMRAKDLEKYSDKDGIVIVGTGLGHVSLNYNKDKLSYSLLEPLKQLIESGIPVVMTSQTIYGRINLNVYSTGRLLKEIGVIGDLANLTPETAYVKLSWILAQTKDLNKIKELYYTNIAGELDRSIAYP